MSTGGLEARPSRRSAVLATAGLAAAVLLWWTMRPAAETTVRGTLVMQGQSSTFLACGEATPLPLLQPPPNLSRLYAEVGGGGEGVFAELRGTRRRSGLTVRQLIRMEPESRGCGEEMPGWEFRAFGNEPFWTVEVWPGHRTELMIVERPCRDTMAGSYYSYSASALIAGAQVEGCARAR